MAAAPNPAVAGPPPSPRPSQGAPPPDAYGSGPVRPEASETKAAFKTTELMAYLAAVAAVILTALVVGADGNGPDPFNAEQALRYITYLTIGYMISRGLAKAGSRSRSADR
jgi:hypothetical protein